MKRLLPQYLLFCMCMLFSVPFLLIARHKWLNLHELFHQWHRFDGVVVDIEDRESNTHSSNGSGFTLTLETRYLRVVRFEMEGKEVLCKERNRSTFRPTLGEAFPVYVSPQDPLEMRIDNFKELRAEPILWTIVGTPFFLIGIPLFFYCIIATKRYFGLKRRGIRLEVTHYEICNDHGSVRNNVFAKILHAKFRVGDVEYEAESESFFGELLEPQKIEIAYDPRNPKIAMIMPLKFKT